MPLRVISAPEISQAFIEAIGKIYCSPDPKVLSLLKSAFERETDATARDMLAAILANAEIGAAEHLPVCQDTGTVVVWAEVGQNAQIEGPCLKEILDQAAEAAWQRFHLRRSLASDPLFSRLPDPDRTPVTLHVEMTSGDRLVLHIALKGGGAENCSALRMFNPTAGVEEIEQFIVDKVVDAGGKPCPPVIVGVGIGGNFEGCALLAKKSLLLPDLAMEPDYAELASRILNKINARGRGVQGFAGSTTALEVRILSAPCHIASLPVAVNVECHSHRCVTIEL